MDSRSFSGSSIGGLQPDDSWFGDPIANSLPSQFVAKKRTASDDPLPSKSARCGIDPSRRFIFEEHLESNFAIPQPSASLAAEDTRQVPSAALQAGRLSFDEILPAPPSADETFASEVWRITGVGIPDYKRVFGLEQSEFDDLQLIQSKYRHLMRLLHPDKRRKDEEARAGGKERCDLAVRLVQEALSKAKKQVQPTTDSKQDLQEEMRRMQEMQRRRARMAMQRQVPSNDATAPSDVESLLSDISQALGSSGTAPAESTTSSTTAELIGLLANMKRS